METKALTDELKEHLQHRNELYTRAMTTKKEVAAALEAVCDEDAFIEGFVSAMTFISPTGVRKDGSKVRFEKNEETGCILAFSWLGDLYQVPKNKAVGGVYD